MLELFATLERVAPKPLAVLVQGETGTGKEEVARALHAKGPRAAQPFVVIDATALPETLAESLLFGHEKGAFTGAEQRRAGFFEAASGGTVFIDEIGELPARPAVEVPARARAPGGRARRRPRAGQGRRARGLRHAPRSASRESRPAASARTSTTASPRCACSLPPLRDRPEDIPVLCEHLLATMAGPTGAPTRIEPDAVEFLRRSPGPATCASCATCSRAPRPWPRTA